METSSLKEYYRVRADINLDAIYGNLQREKEILKPKTKLMVVIKADGYGHGAVPVAKYVDDIADAYGVAIAREGAQLRRVGINKPILVLGWTHRQDNDILIENDITQTIFTYDMAKELSKSAMALGKKAKIHIKIDTGMSRIGFDCSEESVEEIVRISKLEGVNITGIFTHFARADETDKKATVNQYNMFEDMVERLEKRGITFATKHVSNSAGIIDLPECNLDMVRSGISTYGLYPSAEVSKENIFLEPAMSIKSCITYIKTLDKGMGVSYGGTFVTDRKTVVATIPVGYGDGYSRALSSKGRVLVNGQSAPIIGRVCMDQFMVDITDLEGVTLDSEVTLVGADGDECITVEEISAMAGSFNYEFVCMVGKRIPRVYYAGGKKVGTYDFDDCPVYGMELEY